LDGDSGRLAKAYEDLAQVDRAEEQIRAALTKEPDDFLCNVALAVLLMKHDNPADLSNAVDALRKAAISRSPESPVEHRAVNHAIASAICLGLLGDVASARQRLERVRQSDPKNEQVQMILEALDEPRGAR
jgi:Tfp pilus assembly protein PilF